MIVGYTIITFAPNPLFLDDEDGDEDDDHGEEGSSFSAITSTHLSTAVFHASFLHEWEGVIQAGMNNSNVDLSG